MLRCLTRACVLTQLDYSLIIGIREPFHYLKITKEAKLDLRMWLLFIRDFNGKSMFLSDSFLSNDVLSLYTDAAASLGFGAI